MSTTLEVAKQLVDLCKQGKNDEAIDTLYAQDITSSEPGAPPGMDRMSRGLEAVKGKSKWWNDNHEVHSAKVEGPWPNGDQFIVRFSYDLTQKASGQRFQMDEAALYTVRDGKIVEEAFFYAMG